MIKLLAALALALPVWQTPTEDKVDLFWKVKPDQKIEYAVTMDMVAGEHTAKVSSPLTLKIVKINPDGSYEMEISGGKGKMINDGTEQEVPESPAKVEKYDARGNEIKEKKDPKDKKEDDDEEDDTKSLLDMLGFSASPKPLKIGETWDSKIEADEAKEQAGIKVTFTFAGADKFQGVDAWKVTAKGETKGDEKETGDAVYYISKEDGSLIRGEIDIEAAGEETMRTKMRITRKDLVKS